ncbi:MBL fold metallo-hydrolase [Lacrimispora saccharolytica]|uniref:Beta-lactamase domain-containing protein n=1 Tax=Lacrimispora saccharolytica (strain ATCC 35040 / DSM 2544 / NRCC 2533 / WM1) TaxID=610130 RepID=D9RAS1_LACSW|nr:MBL fold metallo-hydrolase [Lacrimispora saccharolytica]ADL06118.1 beta-lactamase domain-containing protein [[Clostridium] saccharolyticum WM1]QRV19767.1 MBL fold metallo-hydrolase [Lacrimispora saccharolytica]
MSDFRIRTYPVGQLGTNCYVMYRESLKKAVIVDPGGDGTYILDMCRQLSLIPEVVLLTHGHFDHILAVKDIKEAFPEVKILAGEQEKALLKDPAVNLSSAFGRACTVNADEYVRDGAILSFGGITFQVLFTPGHTAGSVCYLIQAESVLISGDTLFSGSLGRTDFPTGSQSMILSSIRERLFVLPEETLVYPGHGDITSIGHEKVYNPAAGNRE